MGDHRKTRELVMKTRHHSVRYMCALAIAAALAGCGGGGGGGSVSVSNTPVTGFARVDRMGQPALATALLSKDPAVTVNDAGGNPLNPGSANPVNSFNDQRDQLNRGDPINDGSFAFTLVYGPQANSLQNIHFEIGSQRFQGLGLRPCSTESPPVTRNNTTIGVCISQVLDLPVVPDVLQFNFSIAAGWPNGRHFDDPVADRLLATALLDLSPSSGQSIHSLVGKINTWYGPAGTESCSAPCLFSGKAPGTPSPLLFPFLRPANP
jgi:hypothetical protein